MERKTVSHVLIPAMLGAGADIDKNGVRTKVTVDPNDQSFNIKVSWKNPGAASESGRTLWTQDAIVPASHPGVQRDFSQPNNPIALHALPTAQPSNKQSRNSGGTADALKKERAKATFDVLKLTNVLDGGEAKTARRRWILSPGKDIDVSDRYYWDRHELLKTHLQHFIGIHDDYMGKFIPNRDEITWMTENTMISGSLMNHWGLFLTTLLGQASMEQQGWWVMKAFTCEIIGCYAQTELGHGSNVRGLQTLATFDRDTDSFILDTPTLQSMKWWPGTLGKVATHAVVYAQLVIDGKPYGVHSFMMQIRDENHRPLPGIELGDLGPKLGDGANDTGFMRIHKVRIPRKNMLCKHSKVSKDGVYSKSKKSGSDKMHYATMMLTRGQMVRTAAGMLARAVTIATRYSAVRQQGFVDTSSSATYQSVERQVIDYQMQRFRLMKQLAFTYAIKFIGKWMTDRFQDLQGPGSMSTPVDISDTKALPEIAATSAGLKALCTFWTSQGIEDCRKCCGGNGYLLNSGVAALAADYVWQTTAEGDWIVLTLQTARFLMKTLKRARAGEAVSGPVSYLAPLKDKGFRMEQAAPPQPKSVNDFLSHDYLVQLFQYRALVNVMEAGQELDDMLARGMPYDEAWNSCAVQLCDIVKCHCTAFMLKRFAIIVQGVEDSACRDVLGRLCSFYALSNLLDDQWAGLGLFNREGVKMMRTASWKLLDDLRPDCVALVDAFDIPDRVLNSTLGRYDGNVYESLYEAAKKSPLNQVDPYVGYEEFVRSRLDRKMLKADKAKQVCLQSTL